MLPRSFSRKFPVKRRLTLFLIQIPVLLLLFLGTVSLMGKLKKRRGALNTLFTPGKAGGTAAEERAKKKPALRKARFIPPAKKPPDGEAER